MSGFFNNYGFDELVYQGESKETTMERIKKIKRARLFIKLVLVLIPILTIYALNHGITTIVHPKICMFVVIVEFFMAKDLLIRHGIFTSELRQSEKFLNDYERLHGHWVELIESAQKDCVHPGDFLQEERQRKENRS